jgi:hypothetical protein
VLAFGYATGLELGKIAPYAVRIAENYGTGLAFSGLLTSAVTLFVALFAAFLGRPLVRVGLLKCLRASVVLIVAGASLFVLPLGPAGLMTARLVEGAGYVLAAVAAPAWLANAPIGSARPVFMALWGSVVPVGFAAAAALAGVLPAQMSTGQQLAVFALPVAVLSLPVLSVRGDAPRRDAQADTAGWGDVAWSLAAAFGLYVFLSMGFFSFLPAFAQERGIAALGLVPLMVPLGSFATAAVLPVLRRENGPVLAVIGFGVAAVSAIWMFHQGGAAALFVYAFACGVSSSATLASVLVAAPGEQASARTLGAMAQCGGTTAFLGAPFAGALLDRMGWTALGVALSIAAVAAGATLLLARRRH